MTKYVVIQNFKITKIVNFELDAGFYHKSRDNLEQIGKLKIRINRIILDMTATYVGDGVVLWSKSLSANPSESCWKSTKKTFFIMDFRS